MGSILDEMKIRYKVYDPHVFPDIKLPDVPSVYFVATNHSEFGLLKFESSNLVVDPWGMSNNWGSAKVIRPGRN